VTSRDVRPSFAAPRRVARLALALAAAVVATACGGARNARGTPAPAPASPVVRAAPGDTVYLIQHYVRADRRQQFERFLTNSYWPAVQQVAASDSNMARVLRQTRVLYPARPNDDGTLTYVFVIDPVVRGESYNILELLRRVYTPQETERRYRELTESWARPFIGWPFVQPPYPAAPSPAGAPR
jgi:hypothetical protein